MGLTATLAGQRVTSARVWLPAWGRWHAEVSLDGEHTLTGSAALNIADLELVGTVLSGGAGKGRSFYRVVGGAGGWGRTIPETSEANDAGVKASRVIQAAASACGETVDASTLPATRLGPAWVRPEGPACRALELVAPRGWYVGEDGVTRIGRRAPSALVGSVPRVSDVDLAQRSVTLAPESARGLVPGVVVDGIEAVDVLHHLTEKGLRTTFWGAFDTEDTPGSRRLAAMRALFEQLFPALRFAGVHEYRVVTLAGTRANLQPVRVAPGMPDLSRVPTRPGLPGAKATVALGSRVLVAFVDQSPARPVVVGFEDADGDGFLPVLTEIDATTFVKLADGARPLGATGDLAGGIWPLAGTTRVLG